MASSGGGGGTCPSGPPWARHWKMYLSTINTLTLISFELEYRENCLLPVYKLTFVYHTAKMIQTKPCAICNSQWKSYVFLSEFTGDIDDGCCVTFSNFKTEPMAPSVSLQIDILITLFI